MGVYIKGMKMPKSCVECPLFKSNMSHQLFCRGFRTEFRKEDYEKLIIERMRWCPLIEIPPHGRVIDADAVSLEDGPYEYDEWCKWALDQYQDAPTIIPADTDINARSKEEEV